MCKYCDLSVGEMGNIEGRSCRPINILHETPKKWRIVSTPNPKHRMMESKAINFCPMCGRKLKEADDGND